jgi:hypothetical protein
MNPTLNSSQVRFADYFVICGLDLKTGLEPDVISGTYDVNIMLCFHKHLITMAYFSFALLKLSLK